MYQPRHFIVNERKTVTPTILVGDRHAQRVSSRELFILEEGEHNARYAACVLSGNVTLVRKSHIFHVGSDGKVHRTFK